MHRVPGDFRGDRYRACAATGHPALRNCTNLHLWTGARHSGPCERASIRRPLGRPAARRDGNRAASVLRPPAHRVRSHGVLLSRAGCPRLRPSATATLRKTLARTGDCRDAECFASHSCGRLVPALASRPGRRTFPHGNVPELALLHSLHDSAAASVVAKQRLAPAQSLVRGRAGAVSAAEGAGNHRELRAPTAP